MKREHTNPSQPHLRKLRIVWGSLLLGQVVFLVIVMSVIGSPGAAIDTQTGAVLFFVALGMLVAFVPLGYVIRARVYAQGRQHDGSVKPQSYLTGNVIFLGICQAASLTAILHILLVRSIIPGIFVTLLAIAVQAISFPTGAPLRRS